MFSYNKQTTLQSAMKAMLALMVSFCPGTTLGQTVDTLKMKRDTFSDYEQLKTKQREAGIDRLTYLDSTFNFQVNIPNWLTLRETGSAYVWGGTFPDVEGIKNAIVIKGFKKSDYKSLKEFKNYLVENLEFGHPVRWEQSYIFMGKKSLGNYKDIGEAYKIYLMRRKLLYYCEYILLETRTAYLWIDFTSTQETFDKNIDKFTEFMNGFKTTNFNPVTSR